MTISDFLKQMANRFPTVIDKSRAIETFCNKRDLFAITDLDCALILLCFDITFEIDLKQFFLDDKKLIKAIIDSKYSKDFAQDLFNDEAITVDEEERKEEIASNIISKCFSILERKSESDQLIVTLLYHELSNNIDVKLLDAIKSKLINYSEIAKIEIQCNNKYSFALSQTKYKIISDIIITNLSGMPIKDAKLVFSFDPQMVEISSINVPLIDINQSVIFEEFDVNAHLEELIKLNEKINGNLTIKLLSNYEEEIVSLTTDIDYFSYDTWLENAMEASTALFVTPNDVSIKNAVALIGKEKEKISNDPSLSDYQTGDKENVVIQIKSIYNFLHSQGIAYISAPPSYEKNIGQKIRLPHDVLIHKQGTCLDLSLLFMSCAEAIGLNAFLVLTSRHAFAGVFLSGDNSFPSSVFLDAPEALEMNSQEENEILFIECVDFVAGSAVSFEESCLHGRMNVLRSVSDSNLERDPLFKIIDMQRARSNGFLPLPINFDDYDRVVVDYKIIEQNKIRLARKKFSYKGDKIDLSEVELNKFDIWEKKLLDLSKKNSLINYKIEGKGLQLYFYNLNQLYDAFSNCKRKYKIKPSNQLNNVSSGTFELKTATEDEYKQIEADFENNKMITAVVRANNQLNSLKTFKKENKKYLEETGSNNLYLAIGFIQYFENPRSVNAMYAPIILFPIDLIQESNFEYSIKGREEQAFFNISIFAFLQQEFKLNCDDLLTQINFSDDGAANIDAILNTVSERIKKLDRASVVRTAAISLFSFSKAVMWSDIKFRKEELSTNRIIKSIINKKYICEEKEKISNVIDDTNSPEDLAIPLSADSSQIMAIKDCAEGKSFILQGPPGTGKSQTITNMIVNAIYHGKKVLFVAEKMAALEVVQKRLKQLCLDKFALEAHSLKANKSSVMSQFEKRITFGATGNSKENFLNLANQLKNERQELNRVINLLHRKKGYFLSFYEAFVSYLDINENVSAVDISDEYVKNLNLNKFLEAARLCDILFQEIESNNGYLKNSFVLYRDQNYIPSLTVKTIINKTPKYKDVLRKTIKQLELFNEVNSLSIKIDRKTLLKLKQLLEEKDFSLFLSSLINVDLNEINDNLMEIINLGKKYQRIISPYINNFKDDFFNIDYKSEKQQFFIYENSFFPKKAFGMSKLKNRLKSFRIKKVKIKTKNIFMIYNTIETAKDLENSINEKIVNYPFLFGSKDTFKVRKFDFDKIEREYLVSKNIIEKYKDVFKDNDFIKITDSLKLFSLKEKTATINEIANLLNKEKDLENIGFDFSLADKYGFDYYKVLSLADEWIKNSSSLRNWCSLLLAFNNVKNYGIDFVINYIETNKTISTNLELIFKKSIYEHIIQSLIQGDENGSFNSEELKHHVEHYKNLIKEFNELTIKETAARVSADMPSINDNSPLSSQQGILNKAIKNKCRGKSIRQLFSEIPDILTRVFPVFLMSPMSAAQYLATDMPKFDLVIFDEASQMPTSEAIGAIARGKSLIVVGDSMQMPPTNFFQKQGVNDIDIDLEDQESILDDCDIIGLPSRRLDWHYRSKHESLIRFSNAKFYENKLITFPSPNDMVNKIKFINTHGIYGEKNKTTNEIEAKAIIKEIERRLKSPELSKKSIGVVTFSSAQQDVIDDMLQDFFANNRDLEKKNLESKEPIIIKNLENMQGDERDVIIFSICYGPNKNGTMAFQFGPINKTGGEKRLNVAITRARSEMMVFASFEPELLASNKSQSIGAKELYNFLRYAKYGADALIIPNGSAIETKIGFEKNLAEKLKAKGYKIKTDVGKSSFRIDIGIINPDNENEYILGVLCDSYSYESALTSRDRNVIQPSVLHMLGWNLIRVWSFDYLDNPDAEIEKICNKVEEIRKNPNQFTYENEDLTPKEIEFEEKEIERLNLSTPYISYDSTHYVGDSFNAKFDILKQILDLESPISKEVLRNRFANAMGFSKAGKQIQSDMIKCLIRMGAKQNFNPSKTKCFYWKPGQNEFDIKNYRIGGTKPRSMDDVPKEEIILAIEEVIKNDGAMYKEELKRYVARAFNITSVGRKVNEAIEETINYYLDKQILRTVDNESKIDIV